MSLQMLFEYIDYSIPGERLLSSSYGVAKHYTLLKGYAMLRGTRPLLQSSDDNFHDNYRPLGSSGVPYGSP